MRFSLAVATFTVALGLALPVEGGADSALILDALGTGRLQANRPVSEPWDRERLGLVQELRWQRDRDECLGRQRVIESALRCCRDRSSIESVLRDRCLGDRPGSAFRLPLELLKELERHGRPGLSTDPGMGPDSGENYVVLMSAIDDLAVVCLVHGTSMWRSGVYHEVSPRIQLEHLWVTSSELLDEAWPHQPWWPRRGEVASCLQLWLSLPMFLGGFYGYWLWGCRTSHRSARRMTRLLLGAAAALAGLCCLDARAWMLGILLSPFLGVTVGRWAAASLTGLCWALHLCIRERFFLQEARATQPGCVRSPFVEGTRGRRWINGILLLAGTALVATGAPALTWWSLFSAAGAVGLLAESRRLSLQALKRDRAAPDACGVGPLWILALPALLPLALHPPGEVLGGLGLAALAGAAVTIGADRRLQGSLQSELESALSQAPPAAGSGDRSVASRFRPVEAPTSGRCAVCGSLEGDTRWVLCPDCGTPHHATCHEYTGRCAIYGCGASSPRESIGDRVRGERPSQAEPALVESVGLEILWPEPGLFSGPGQDPGADLRALVE